MTNQKASFRRTFGLFAIAMVLFLGLRWSLYEPFVIPSGSMIPTLLIHDHIVVQKSAYGVRIPFTQRWISGPKIPNRNDVVVFISVENPDIYMIKRVIGLPGETVTVLKDGQLEVNGRKVLRQETTFEDAAQIPAMRLKEPDVGAEIEDTRIFSEGETPKHFALQQKSTFRDVDQTFVVPPGRIFAMGDNRDNSRDSRFWGSLPIENLVGRALFIWLSCSQTMSETNYLCDPSFIRWQRLFYPIQ